MIELDILTSVDIEKISPEKIILNFLEEEKTILYLGDSDELDNEFNSALYKRINKHDNNINQKFDYVILTEILERIDDPQNLITTIKNITDTVVIYEYKFDEGCYNNEEWKKPWTKIGLEYFLGKEFDYVNSIFLGYATIHFCKFPYNKELDNHRIEENAIR